MFYSIIAYLCWWEKPPDVEEPIPLQLDQTLLSKLGHNVNEQRTGYFRKQYSITEKRDQGGFLRMAARASYDLGVVFGTKAEVWSTVMAIANGALHVTVWNSHFPTSTERFLWRISALGLGALPLILCLAAWKKGIEQYATQEIYKLRFEDHCFLFERLSALAKSIWYAIIEDEIKNAPDEQPDERSDEQLDEHSDERLDEHSDEHSNKRSIKWPVGFSIWCRILSIGGVLLSAAGYLLCIEYLTLEAFISVRSLPAGAYSVPRWSNIFPHF
ncbi:hypothetical protein GQ44DRAFT_831711 [Phaeosphaeriaceae sp. PMI808]|nr:hypothetical protein GQ44DRAFT_831711 [Phaeosphaeriaceae sp. PMI808]